MTIVSKIVVVTLSFVGLYWCYKDLKRSSHRHHMVKRVQQLYRRRDLDKGEDLLRSQAYHRVMQRFSTNVS